jgi:exopolysaccharide biosynthesis polyprenyl glycosylphosphotransferase
MTKKEVLPLFWYTMLMKRIEILLTAILLPLDALALLGGFSAAYYVRDEFGLLPAAPSIQNLATRLQYDTGAIFELSYSQYFHYLTYIIPMMLFVFAALGLYRLRNQKGGISTLLSVCMGVSVGIAGILLLFLLKKEFFLPRSTVLYSWVFCILAVLCVRAIKAAFQNLFYSWGWGLSRIGIIGEQEHRERFIRLLNQQGKGFAVIYSVTPAKVQEIIQSMPPHLDELVVLNQRYSASELELLRNGCMELGITFSFVPALFTQLQSRYQVRDLAHTPVLTVNPTPLVGWGRLQKRLFDVVGALMLLLLFFPLFLVISWAIVLTSPGPILYGHQRIGRGGTTITIYKFRTLHWKYCIGVGGGGEKHFEQLLQQREDLLKEWEANHKLRHDPRVSRVGSFLRKSSLDELPQLINVLRGDASLVGPRPIVREEVGKYGDEARLLFTVRPGITGLWQVSGRSDTSYAERIALDTHYIEHWSIWRDIAILGKTVAVLWKNHGAY